MGDGVRHCAEAVERTLRDGRTRLLGISSFYTTSPVSPILQDDFVNCVFSILWDGSPSDLLLLLNGIESDMGRKRTIPSGPRIIDLDILLFGAIVMSSPSLIIPHPELHRRRFVLVPCIEIDPSLLHPALKQPLTSFLAGIDSSQTISILLGATEVMDLISTIRFAQSSH